VAVVGVTIHLARPEAVELARGLTGWLSTEGHEVRMPALDAGLVGVDPSSVDGGGTSGGPLSGADFAVALGGDGTVLRTVELLAGADVPILGVNLGQLGYLTEVEPGGVHEAVRRVVAGDYRRESRMLLEVLHRSGSSGGVERYLALNEASLDRTVSGHTVRLEVGIDGRPFTPYEVDGLIVATPTGSTAYSLSAGGPVVAPSHRLMLLTPVSPHMLFDRTLVLEASSTVGVEVVGHRSGVLAVDGRLVGDLDPGDEVRCTAASEEAHLVVFGDRDFPGLLKAKFKLGDR